MLRQIDSYLAPTVVAARFRNLIMPSPETPKPFSPSLALAVAAIHAVATAAEESHGETTALPGAPAEEAFDFLINYRAH